MEQESKVNVRYACDLALSHYISKSLKVEHHLDLELLCRIKYLIMQWFRKGCEIHVQTSSVLKGCMIEKHMFPSTHPR